jgi:hypothetical protein
MDIILRSLLRDLFLAVDRNNREQVSLLLSNCLQGVPDRFGVRTAFRAAVAAGNLASSHYFDFTKNGIHLGIDINPPPIASQTIV